MFPNNADPDPDYNEFADFFDTLPIEAKNNVLASLQDTVSFILQQNMNKLIRPRLVLPVCHEHVFDRRPPADAHSFFN
jgi:hypothetical protein